MSSGTDVIAKHPLPDDALLESASELARPRGPDLLARTQPYLEWQDKRCQAGLCPFPNSPQHSPDCTTKFREGRRPHTDLDFSSRDPLGLSASALVHQAAARSVREQNGCAAGQLARELTSSISDWLGHPHVTLFESGLDARVRTVTALVGRRDFVLIDRGADPSFSLAAREATQNVLLYNHLDLDEVRAQLCEVRGRDGTHAVLVVTQSLFPLESDAPDLPQLQAICREFGARLLVDVSQDIGVRGPAGSGQVGIQGMLGELDLVVGGFGGALVSNLGFLATGSREAAEFVMFRSGSHVTPQAPSPIQCAVAAEALRVARSGEGTTLRSRIEHSVEILRSELAGRGVPSVGDPMPSVVVHLGWEGGARLVSSLVVERGLFANLIEYPVVPPGAARLTLQVPARLVPEDARRAAEIVAASVRRAWEVVAGNAG